MSIFPDKPYDGQQVVEEIGNEQVRIWTYSQAENEWTYKEYGGGGSVVYTDQVLDRQTLATQTTVNLATAATASATQQNVDEIQGTKSKGTWQFHGGPIPDDGVPAVNQFWLADKEDQRTQEFCNAAFVRIHALGNQNKVTRDRVELGRAVVGDKLIIQNLADTDGCSYTITSVEEHGPVDGDYTQAYALYGVEPDPLYCIGSVAPAEIVSIKLKSAPTEGGGGDFLPLSGGSITGQLSVAGSFNCQGGALFPFAKDKGLLVYDVMGGQVFSAYGDLYGKGAMYYGAVEQSKHVATKEYVDNSIGKIEIPTGGGGLPTTKYDGNRLFVVGNGVSDLNNGEVVFTNSSGNIVDTVALVTRIVLPIDEFNWDACSKSGFVYVKNGANSRGYFQVYDVITNEGRNKMLKVKLFDFVEDTNLDPGYGHPCYFNGVFFG